MYPSFDIRITMKDVPKIYRGPTGSTWNIGNKGYVPLETVMLNFMQIALDFYAVCDVDVEQEIEATRAMMARLEVHDDS